MKILIVAMICASALAAGVSEVERTGLFKGCSECKGFVSAVAKLGKDVEKIEEAVYVSPEHQTKEDVEFPEVDAQLANSHEERLCEGLEPEYVLSCKAVAQIYGLENINSIVASAPDLLCEQLVSCRTSSAKKGRKLLTHEQVLTVLGDAIVSDDQLPASDVLTQADPGVAGGVMGMMTSLFKLRMQSQMMMQAMQMRQQLMENEHKMMQKIMRAMARNRAIRCELKHLKKMAYRAQPGNCDCCDACLPPAKGGKGKKGKK